MLRFPINDGMRKMSSSLTIEPTQRKKNTLSTELKFALRKRNNGQTLNNKEFTKSDIPYFSGLYDAGIKDAQDVINLIERYDSITINEEF